MICKFLEGFHLFSVKLQEHYTGAKVKDKFSTEISL